MPTEDELAKARTEVAHFRRWCRANVDALLWIRARAMAYEARGREFSVRHIFECLRWDSGIALEGDKHASVPNVFAPIIARCLVANRPGMRDLVRINPSVYDWVELPDVFGGMP